jgi:hypothetical protein
VGPPGWCITKYVPRHDSALDTASMEQYRRKGDDRAHYHGKCGMQQDMVLCRECKSCAGYAPCGVCCHRCRLVGAANECDCAGCGGRLMLIVDGDPSLAEEMSPPAKIDPSRVCCDMAPECSCCERDCASVVFQPGAPCETHVVGWFLRSRANQQLPAPHFHTPCEPWCRSVLRDPQGSVAVLNSLFEGPWTRRDTQPDCLDQDGKLLSHDDLDSVFCRAVAAAGSRPWDENLDRVWPWHGVGLPDEMVQMRLGPRNGVQTRCEFPLVVGRTKHSLMLPTGFLAQCTTHSRFFRPIYLGLQLVSSTLAGLDVEVWMHGFDRNGDMINFPVGQCITSSSNATTHVLSQKNPTYVWQGVRQHCCTTKKAGFLAFLDHTDLESAAEWDALGNCATFDVTPVGADAHGVGGRLPSVGAMVALQYAIACVQRQQVEAGSAVGAGTGTGNGNGNGNGRGSGSVTGTGSLVSGEGGGGGGREDGGGRASVVGRGRERGVVARVRNQLAAPSLDDGAMSDAGHTEHPVGRGTGDVGVGVGVGAGVDMDGASNAGHQDQAPDADADADADRDPDQGYGPGDADSYAGGPHGNAADVSEVGGPTKARAGARAGAGTRDGDDGASVASEAAAAAAPMLVQGPGDEAEDWGTALSDAEDPAAEVPHPKSKSKSKPKARGPGDDDDGSLSDADRSAHKPKPEPKPKRKHQRGRERRASQGSGPGSRSGSGSGSESGDSVSSAGADAPPALEDDDDMSDGGHMSAEKDKEQGATIARRRALSATMHEARGAEAQIEDALSEVDDMQAHQSAREQHDSKAAERAHADTGYVRDALLAAQQDIKRLETKIGGLEDRPESPTPLARPVSRGVSEAEAEAGGKTPAAASASASASGLGPEAQPSAGGLGHRGRRHAHHDGKHHGHGHHGHGHATSTAHEEKRGWTVPPDYAHFMRISDDGRVLVTLTDAQFADMAASIELRNQSVPFLDGKQPVWIELRTPLELDTKHRIVLDINCVFNPVSLECVRGDEFVCAALETRKGRIAAQKLAQKMERAAQPLAAASLSLSGDSKLGVGVGIGMATLSPPDMFMIARPPPRPRRFMQLSPGLWTHHYQPMCAPSVPLEPMLPAFAPMYF